MRVSGTIYIPCNKLALLDQLCDKRGPDTHYFCMEEDKVVLYYDIYNSEL